MVTGMATTVARQRGSTGQKHNTGERKRSATPRFFRCFCGGDRPRKSRKRPRPRNFFRPLSLLLSISRPSSQETRRRHRNSPPPTLTSETTRETARGPRSRVRAATPRAHRLATGIEPGEAEPSARATNKTGDSDGDGTHDVGCAGGILGLGGRANIKRSGARPT